MNNAILYVGGFVLPDGNAAAQRVMANAKLLQQIGYEVILIGVDKEVDSDVSVVSTKETIQGFTTYKAAYPNSMIAWAKQLTSVVDIRAIMTHIGREKIKAVIAYNYPAIALERLLGFCTPQKIKIISDCTEWAYLENSKRLRSLLKNWDTQRRMKKVHPKLDGIIAISDYLFNYYKGSPTAILKLPPLVDKRDSKWKELQGRALQDKVQMIYAGSPGNGGKDRIDKIIEALAKIKDGIEKSFKLIVIGITKQQYLEDFSKGNIPRNMEEKVEFRGRLPHNETIKAIKQAHYTIFIRDKNLVTKAGFPTKFVESISCGTPVLTNRSSNISEYLKEGELGFFLDVRTEEQLRFSLSNAINVSKKKVVSMKDKCRSSNIFDISSNKKYFENFLKQEVFKS